MTSLVALSPLMAPVHWVGAPGEASTAWSSSADPRGLEPTWLE
eukprot:CAMPEP_0117498946 /NCGR_PEP_ID=MMETSP0784-20121206/21982_2 /TAXON_ID=39447 /ORGANISM="" /LENGTH=42 /DNA_ID= /DNA_START= /DNA_END= /DNA_ORIENTATION=